MHYLATLRDEDIFASGRFPVPSQYEKRVTVKAIVRNNEGQFAFVTNPVHELYLLAGGGAESEYLEKEIRRECLEEIRYKVKVVREIARIHEFRDRDAKEYETICFLVEIEEEISEDLRTEDEKNNGLSVVWFSGEKAREILKAQVKKVNNNEVGFYNTTFNIVRDQLFFEAFYILA